MPKQKTFRERQFEYMDAVVTLEEISDQLHGDKHDKLEKCVDIFWDNLKCLGSYVDVKQGKVKSGKIKR